MTTETMPEFDYTYDEYVGITETVRTDHVVVAEEPGLMTHASDALGGFLTTHADDITQRPSADKKAIRFCLKTATVAGRAEFNEVTPNMLIASLQACDDFARSVGQEALITICDGMPTTHDDYTDVAEQLRWSAAVDEYNAQPERSGAEDVRFIDLNKYPSSPMPVHRVGFQVSNIIDESDVIVSLTVGKTHRRMGISGAEKTAIGYLAPAGTDEPKLSRKHHLLSYVLWAVEGRGMPPTFHIMDNTQGIVELEGPRHGRLLHGPQMVLCGEDPWAIDVAFAQRCNFDPALIQSLHHHRHNSSTEPTVTCFETESSRVQDFTIRAAPTYERQFPITGSLTTRGTDHNARIYQKQMTTDQETMQQSFDQHDRA